MAKISARGAREVARWKRGEAVLVLTDDGRLLHKALAGDGYTVRRRVANDEPGRALGLATAYAIALGYERASTRRR